VKRRSPGRRQGRPRTGVTYRIEVAPAVVRQLRKLDRAALRRVHAAIELLATEPRSERCQELVGGDSEWRIRTGDRRVGYEIHDNVLLIHVVAVGTTARSTHADGPHSCTPG
jgi:mRNA interferase RelE/StbE